jgi:hypothetical protein
MNQKLQRILLLSVTLISVTSGISLASIAAKQELPKSQSQNSKAYRYLANLADRSRHNINIPIHAKNKAKIPKNLGFLVSYETETSGHHFDLMMQDVAFTYDNAVAALAFIAAGDRQRAQQIVDTILYAQQRDRFFRDGRVRNAYRGGKSVVNAGKVLLPGRFDPQAKRWIEQESQISAHTGNIAWAMLALLGYYQTYGGKSYLDATVQMGEWVEKNCHSTTGAGGYTGGFSGWERQNRSITYKSTEHNIDLYAAFQRLYLITGDRKWEQRANRAKQFVLAMWDRQEGKFWTGTKVDGVTTYREVIPVDIQAWALLAFGKAGKPYQTALKYAEKHHQLAGGFDFNQDRDGIWYEGTAQMALAYQITGQTQKAQNAIATLHAGQDVTGGIFTSDRPELTTGFILPEGYPWLYYRRLHVGATAWTVLAQKGVNPFWIGSTKHLTKESE